MPKADILDLKHVEHLTSALYNNYHFVKCDDSPENAYQMSTALT